MTASRVWIGAGVDVTVLALTSIAVSLALVVRLNGDRPAVASTILFVASTVHLAFGLWLMAGVMRDAAFGRRRFAWWATSAIALGICIGWAALGEPISIWVLPLCVLAFASMVVTGIRLRR
jgi:hypothetical protein